MALANLKPKQFDKEIYKQKSAVERVNVWIEAKRKVNPRYERLEISYLGLMQLSCATTMWKVLV
jgi:transposase